MSSLQTRRRGRDGGQGYESPVAYRSLPGDTPVAYRSFPGGMLDELGHYQARQRLHRLGGNPTAPAVGQRLHSRLVEPEHIREDAGVFGFSLADDEMAAINAPAAGRRMAAFGECRQCPEDKLSPEEDRPKTENHENERTLPMARGARGHVGWWARGARGAIMTSDPALPACSVPQAGLRYTMKRLSADSTHSLLLTQAT